MILINHYFQLKKTDEEYPVSNFSYSIVIINNRVSERHVLLW